MISFKLLFTIALRAFGFKLFGNRERANLTYSISLVDKGENGDVELLNKVEIIRLAMNTTFI